MKLMVKHKIIGLGLLATLIPVLIITSLIFVKKSSTAHDVKAELDNIGRSELSQIAKDVYGICEVAHDLLDKQVRASLNIAISKMEDFGKARVSSGRMVQWQAINQFTGQSQTVSLPAFYLGNRWLGQVYSSSEQALLVDQVKQLSGAICTVFQKMNPQGDMLRVATSVINENGNRAIGTFIPARDEKGKKVGLIR
ncbi:MAG: hypothetical protein Kow0037_07720 [Calditrichia bacterium]